MFYYLYEIKNLLNGKIYVGVHKTKNLNDGYMGSGSEILTEIKNIGEHNFTKTILEFFDNSEQMFSREKDIVNREFLMRPDVYNKRRGGTGGFDFINSSKTMEERIHAGTLAQEAIRLKRTNRFSEDYISPFADKELLVELQKRANSSSAMEKKKETWKKTGRAIGSKNSQFGTMWITNGVENKKISKNSIIPDGWNKGRTMGR
jgi:hypothetical protein